MNDQEVCCQASNQSQCKVVGDRMNCEINRDICDDPNRMRIFYQTLLRAPDRNVAGKKRIRRRTPS